MARITGTPTPCFWNFVGASIFIGSIALGWTIIRGNAVEVEAANYKLRTNAAIVELKEVSSTLERSAASLPIATQKRKAIEQELSNVDAVLEDAEISIDLTTEK